MNNIAEQRFEVSCRSGEIYDGLDLANRVGLRLALADLALTASRWSMNDLATKLDAGKPVYIFGRRVTNAKPMRCISVL